MLRGISIAFLLPLAFAANPIPHSAPTLGWVKQITGSGASQVIGVASDAQGNLYLTGNTSAPDFPATETLGPASGTSAFVIKLNTAGEVAYAVRAGGSGIVTPVGIVVAADGSVFIGGTTTSADFPVTPGSFQSTPPAASSVIQTSNGSFLLRLNPDGTLAWATYFGDANNFISAIAIGADGNPFIAGFTYGGLPVTQGAYQNHFEGSNICPPGAFIAVCPGPPTNGFLTKFNANGKSLIYSTYEGNQGGSVNALVIDPLGNAYFNDLQFNTLNLINASGSSVIASTPSPSYFVHAMALDSEGNLYLTGRAGTNFRPTPGAFQASPQPAIPQLSGYFGVGASFDEAFVAKLDGTLTHVLAATLLGGEGADLGQSLAIDSSGNVILAGQTTSKAFPTRAPFQASFAAQTGFVAELDNTLTQLIFSTYAGDSRPFSIAGAIPAPGGAIVLAGSTGVAVPGDIPPVYNPGNAIIANQISLPPAPSLQLDAVVNLASKYAVALSSGEAIEAHGSGFGADTQILMDGAPLPAVSRSSTSVVSLLPASLKTSGSVRMEISSGGAISNPVVMPLGIAAPGIYSIHGTGFGQGYIRNSDGSFNSPNRPAKPGDAITIFATGVGNLTFQDGYVVTPLPISIFVDGLYANGVSSKFAGAGGLPGKTYQITVTIPTTAYIAKNNPSVPNFIYPPQVAVTMILGQIDVNGGYSPAPDAAVSQPGIALYIKN